MSRNGSGTYNLPAGNPVVTGTTITTTWANTTLSDIASALTGSVSADGQTPMSGDLNMGSNKVTSLATPTVDTDAATKAYVDLTQTASAITGGIITGATLTNDIIDSTPIGSTTRSSVKATTLDLGLATQSVAIGQGNASIMKNRIINGAMVIDQRNAGASVTPSGLQYVIDRFAVNLSQSSKITTQQNQGSVTPPIGFKNYLGITSSSSYSVTSGDYFTLQQVIEGFNISDLGWGTGNAKTVTLSFQVYSSLTGTFGGVIRNGNGTRSYPFTYSIPVANTWTSMSVTVAGDTTGTWATDNTAGIYVYFGLGVGSTYSGTAGSWASANYVSATGATSVVGTSGATFYITGVQLEVGSSATGFEYRQYGTELDLCYRYFQQYKLSGAGALGGSGQVPIIGFTYPKIMRSTPTISWISGGIAGNGSVSSNITSLNSITNTSATSSIILYVVASLGVVTGAVYVGDALTSFNSEL